MGCDCFVCLFELTFGKYQIADAHEQSNRKFRYTDLVLKCGRPEEKDCYIAPALQKGGKHLKKRVSSYDTNSLISSISSSDNLFSISKSFTSASNSNPSKSL